VDAVAPVVQAQRPWAINARRAGWSCAAMGALAVVTGIVWGSLRGYRWAPNTLTSIGFAACIGGVIGLCRQQLPAAQPPAAPIDWYQRGLDLLAIQAQWPMYAQMAAERFGHITDREVRCSEELRAIQDLHTHFEGHPNFYRPPDFDRGKVRSIFGRYLAELYRRSYATEVEARTALLRHGAADPVISELTSGSLASALSEVWKWMVEGEVTGGVAAIPPLQEVEHIEAILNDRSWQQDPRYTQDICDDMARYVLAQAVATGALPAPRAANLLIRLGQRMDPDTLEGSVAALEGHFYQRQLTSEVYLPRLRALYNVQTLPAMADGQHPRAAFQEVIAQRWLAVRG
jgi:hypothetical protein